MENLEETNDDYTSNIFPTERDVCDKNECLKDIELKLPPIFKSQDKWDIKALPTKFGYELDLLPRWVFCDYEVFTEQKDAFSSHHFYTNILYDFERRRPMIMIIQRFETGCCICKDSLKGTWPYSDIQHLMDFIPNKYVAKLSCVTKSKSKPSAILRRFEEKGKKECEAIIKKMKTEMEVLSLQIENEIRKQSRILKNSMKNTLTEVADHFNNFDLSTENVYNVEHGSFAKLIYTITSCNENRQLKVEEFYNLMMQLEKERAEQLRTIIGTTSKQLFKSSYKLPYDVQRFFENEILKINQITLGNHHYYNELRNQLQLRCEHDILGWMATVKDLKEKWKDVLKTRAIQDLRKLRDDEDKIENELQKIKEIAEHKKEFERMQCELEDNFDSENPIPVQEEQINEWLLDTQIILASLDKSAVQLINVYKLAVVDIFTRYFEELQKVIRLVHCPSAHRTRETVLKNEIYTPVIEKIKIEYTYQLKEVQEIWDNFLADCKQTVDKTHSFLLGACTLWSKHFKRVAVAQELILKDLKINFGRNNKSTATFECRMNIALDKLRQQPTVVKLEMALKETDDILDEITNLYSSHYATEMGVIAKYKGLVEIESNILIAEMERFLGCNPQDQECDPKHQGPRASRIIYQEDPLSRFIPPQLLFAKYSVNAISNWKFGLWEAIKHYQEHCKEELLTLAKEWIEKQSKTVSKRLEVKMAFHKSRYKRVRSTIYEKRLEEIRSHELRFEQHKTGIQQELLDTKNSADIQQYFSQQQLEFNDGTDEFRENFENAVSSSNVHNISKNLETFYMKFEDNLSKKQNSLTQNWSKVISEIQVSNWTLLRALRMFPESGNFSNEEIVMILKVIPKLLANAQKGIAQISKEVQKYEQQFLKKINLQKEAIEKGIVKIENELKFKEDVIRKIRALQHSIREEYFQTNSKYCNTEVFIKKCIKSSFENMGDVDYTPTFLDGYHEAVNKMEDLAVLLNNAESLIPKVELAKRMSYKVEMKRSSRASPTSSKLGSKSPRPSHAAVYILYRDRPVADNSYLSKLNLLIYSSFVEIEGLAKIFYAGATAENLKRVQPTFHDFISEVLQKYKSYRLQTEASWIDFASKYLEVITEFRQYIDKYGAHFIHRFFHNALGEFKIKFSEIMDHINEQKQFIEDEYKNIHHKLKPLHGHPNNRKLLDNLNKEMDSTSKETQNIVIDLLDPYKEIVRKEHAEIISKVKDLDTIFEENVDISNLSEIKDKLTDQMTAILTMEDRISRGSTPNTYIVDPNSRSLENVNKTFEDKTETRSSASRKAIGYMKGESKLNPSAISLTGEELYSVKDMLDDMDEFVERIMADLTNMGDVERKIHEYYKRLWKTDVEKIKQLYTVKYDITKDISRIK